MSQEHCTPNNHNFDIVTIAVDSTLPGKTRTLRYCHWCAKTSELVRGENDTFFWSTVDEKNQESNPTPDAEEQEQSQNTVALQ